MADISRSFTYKMAAKTNWHRYGTKLRHCHPMYSCRRREPAIGRYLSPAPELNSGQRHALIRGAVASPRGGLGWTCPPHFCWRSLLKLIRLPCLSTPHILTWRRPCRGTSTQARYACRVHSGERKTSVWCLSVCPVGRMLSHSPRSSTDAASVRIGPTVG